MELRRFFDRAVRAAFTDLALRNDPVGPYLADVLARFAHTEHLHPRGVTLPRLETVGDMLLEITAAWRTDAASFQPEREVAVRRHLGDYALFMMGIFPERVERVASSGLYISQGRQAYRFVSEHERATTPQGAPLFRRLADRFEHYAGALDYTRRVYFHDHPPHPFFRLGLG